MDHDAIKNAEIRIAEVQLALDEVQRVLQAAQRVQDTAEKSIRVLRPVAITVACGAAVFAVVVVIGRRHR